LNMIAASRLGSLEHFKEEMRKPSALPMSEDILLSGNRSELSQHREELAGLNETIDDLNKIKSKEGKLTDDQNKQLEASIAKQKELTETIDRLTKKINESTGEVKGKYADHAEFIKGIAPIAEQIGEQLKVSAADVASIMATESTWGRNVPGSYNYAGIKGSNVEWLTGKARIARTQEAFTEKEFQDALKQGLNPVVMNAAEVIGKFGQKKYDKSVAEGKKWYDVNQYFKNFESPEEFAKYYARALESTMKSANTADIITGYTRGHYTTAPGDKSDEDRLRKQASDIKELLPGRALGSLVTGRLFENFGTGTPIVTHNLESVMTPDQLRSIVTDSQERLARNVVDNINSGKTQQAMLTTLSEIREILEKSNKYHREIAQNV
jgi:flagellum-specific peptidoglycan hydrolase FlgJ